MTVDDDEALARALQEKYERQAKRRQQMPARANSSRFQGNRSDTGNPSDEEGPPVSLRASSTHRPPLPASARSSRNVEAAMINRERSTHRRVGVPPEPEAPDTSNDADLARRLSERSSHSRRARSTERSSHRRSDPPEDRVEEEKNEVAPPDTSNDEAIARRLAERANRHATGRSTRKIEPPPEEAHAPPPPDTSKDEELARRLAMGFQSKSKRRLVPVEAPNAPTEEPAPSTENDEELARKLQQQLEDEEMAQRLSEQEAKRRRRANHLARKKAAERSRKAEGEQSTPTTSLQPETPARAQSVRRTKSKENLFDSEDGYGDDIGNAGMQRGRSRRTNNNMARSRSRSRDSDDGIGGSNGRSRHRSRSRDPDDAIGGPNGRIRQRSRSRDPDDAIGGPYGRSRQKSTPNMRSMSPTRREQAPIIDLMEESDRDLAVRIDQESRDEALARSLTMREAQRLAVYSVETPQTRNGRSRWTCRRIMSLAIPLVVILAACVALSFAFTGGSGLPSLTGAPPIFDESDPFQGKNPSEANRWKNDGNGLELELLNALDTRWHTNFEVAVSEWDFGDPDALTLTVQTVDVDSTCSERTGFLKVCNGDYGETKWRGINQIMISGGWIISSVAKLNEFYLATADEAQRQYTMCHEMGHGFGLPHTDENFFNADLGNCMDYTSNPEVNKSPDESNYAFLVDLYGTVPNRRRNLRQRNSSRHLPEKPPDLQLRVDEAMAELDDGLLFSGGNYQATLLHSSDFAEGVLIDLRDGFQLQVSMLLALPGA